MKLWNIWSFKTYILNLDQPPSGWFVLAVIPRDLRDNSFSLCTSLVDWVSTSLLAELHVKCLPPTQVCARLSSLVIRSIGQNHLLRRRVHALKNLVVTILVIIKSWENSEPPKFPRAAVRKGTLPEQRAEFKYSKYCTVAICWCNSGTQGSTVLK